MMLTLGVGQMWGAPDTYNFSSLPTSGWSTSGGSQTINSKSWTYSSCTYIGNSSSKIQVGSSKNPQTSNWTIQTAVSNFGSNKKITSVAITAYTTATTATYDISAGGSSVKSGSLTTSSATYTANNLNVTDGNIVITLRGSSSSKAMYLSNISVTYEDNSGPTLYTVTYDANGGEVTPTSHKQESAGSSITLATPTREGYTFNGWYTATSGGTKRGDAGASYTPTSNETVHAQWTIKNYAVHWKVNSNDWEGSTHGSPSTNANHGTKPTTIPTAPTSAECDNSKVFVGWTATENYSNASTPPTDLFITAAGAPNVTDNVTFHAVFATNATNATRVTSASGMVSGNYYVFVNEQSSYTKLLKKDLTVGSTIPSEESSKITTQLGECWLITGDNSTNGFTITSSSNKILGLASSPSNGTYVTNTTTKSKWIFGVGATNFLRIWNKDHTSFKIEYYNSGSCWAVWNSTSSSYVDWKVYKVNYSNYATTCCTPLAQINGSVSCTSGTAATLSWSAVTGAESYKVKVPGSSNCDDWTTATSPFSVTGLTAGQNYTAYFKAFDSNGSHCTEGPESTTAFTTPQITVTGTPLAEMTYAQGDGPSGAVSFVVKGKGLCGDNSGQLTVTAPTNFEVSLDNSSWGDSKTITKANAESNSGQTVYVRLKVGLLNANSPFGPSNVVISGGNAASVNVSVSGTVTSACSAPAVATPTCTSVAEGTITVSCASITVGVNCDVDEYGFVWKASSEPSISDNKTSNAGAYAANFSKALTIDGFATGTTYNIKAYGHNAAGYALSSNLTVIPRKVTFNKNGHGTQSAPATQYMVDGGKATQPSALTDDNYDFGGWYDNADWTQGDAWDFANDVVSDDDQVLYAKWTPKDYTITTTLNNVSISEAIASPYTYTGSAAGISRTFSVVAENFFMPEDIVVTMAGTGTLVKDNGYTYNSSNGAFELTATITGNVTITATATAKLKSIAITAQPTTRKYLVGDVFSSTGATVTATMGDGNTKTVSATWSPSTALSAGESQTVTASYTEAGINKTITTTIDVYSVTVNKVDMNGDDIDDANVTATCSGRTLSQSVGTTNYKFNSWQVSEGSVNVSTNTITGAPSGDVVINAKFHKPISIAWKVGTGNAGSGTTEVKYGTQMKDLTLPTDVEDDDLEDCGTNKFMGWSANEVKGTGKSAPADLFTEASGTTEITSDKTFYAVFANASGSGSADDYVLVESELSDWSGTYVLVDYGSSSYAMSSDVTSGKFGAVSVSPNNKVINCTNDKLIWTITKGTGDNASKYSVKSKKTNKYANSGNSSTSAELSNSAVYLTFDYTASYGIRIKGSYGRWFCNYSSTEFRTYSGATNDGLSLYKKNEVTYSDYQTSCCTTLDAVSNVSVVPGRTSATVSWDKLTNASGYEYKLGDADWATASVADANNPSISLSALSGATSYAIQIRATGDGSTYCDKGTASAVTNFKTLSRVTAAVNDGARGAAKVSMTSGSGWADYVDAADGTTIYLQATPSSASWILGSWGASNGDVASNQLTGWMGDVTVTANFAAAELPTLATPTGMSSSAVTAISATISWNAVANSSSYVITCAGATQGDVTESAGVCSCTLTGLSAGTAYTWNVQAVGDNISYKSGAACADQNFTTVAKKPTAISITTPPTKTTYLEGDDFDATGLVVSVTYNTGESDGVYTTITPSTNLAAGTTKVTISATLNETTVSVDQAITVRTKYVLTFLNNGIEVSHKDLYEGAAYGTLPTLTTVNAFDATSTTFMGWTTANIYEKQADAPAYVTAESVMGAADVTLNAVWAAGTLDDVQVSEDFSSITAGDNTSTSGSGSALEAGDYTANLDGTNSSAVYKAGGAVKLGTSKVSGYLSTKTLSAAVGDKLEIEFDVKGWSSVEGAFSVQSSNAAFTDQAISYTSVMGGSFESKSVEVTLTVANPQIKFNSTGRVFIDNIVITKKGHTEDYITNLVSSEVTIATLTNGSTISVKNGNANVTSGDEIAAGTALTITTNSASGYRVDNLRAYKTGDENTPVAITESSLTMPIYGITITADETAVYPVSVAVAAGQSTWGSVTIDGEAGPAYVNEDDTPEMVATPNAGYQFKTWSVTGGSYDLGDKALTDASIAPQVYAEATFTATFEEKPMTGLTLSQDALTVDLASGTASLSVTGYTPSDLLEAKKTVAWSSSDETVAIVSDGTITLKKSGTATITAAWTEDESIYASCALTVYQWNFTGYTVTTAPKIAYYTIEKFSTAGVVIKENYERSDNSSTKQETYSGAWTAKLNDEAIEDGDDLTAGEYTLKLYIGEEEIASYTMTVEDVPVDLFEVGIWDIDAPTFQTGTYTMPSLSNQTAGDAATCKDHNLFVGWTTDPDDPKTENITAGGTEGIVASNTTYYAVWAKMGTIPDDVEKNSFVEADKNGSTLNAGISYTTAQNGATNGAGIYSSALRIYQKSGGGYGGYILFTASTGYTITAIELTTSTGSKFGYGPDKDHLTQGTISNGKVTLTNLSVSAMCIATSSESGATSDRLNISAISVHYQTTGPTDYITDCETRYTIEFYADQTLDDKVAEKKYKDGTVIEMPDKYIGMSKEYHTFAGWRSAAEYTASIDKVYAVGEEYTVTGDDYIYGEWTPFSQGAVTVDGEALEGSPFYATQSYTLPTPDAISGKKFIGWSDGENIMAPGEYAMPDPAVNITYTSQWFDLLPTPTSVSFTNGEWILVTAQDQLHAGDFIVVAAANADYAMGAEADGGNNRTVQAVTKSGNTLSYESVVVPLFLQNGYGANQYALYDMSADKYLYAASSSKNYLKIDEDFDENGSWLITIANGSTSVMAQGANSHNDLRYNAGGSIINSVFSCYAEGGQQPIALYRWIETIKTEGNVNASDVMPTYNVNLVVQTNTSIDMDVERTVNDFYIEAMEGKSGQITHPENLNINGNAYYDLTLDTTGTMDNSKWYAFAVPFQVDAATGIQRLSNKGVASNAGFNSHYVLLKYDSEAYASSGQGWKYVTRGETLMPGKFYMIALNSNEYNRVRMTKKAGTPVNNKANLTLSTVGTGEHANWNALANNALAYVNVNATGGNASLKVQVYSSATDQYIAYGFGEVTFTVGTPFFFQATEEGTMSVEIAASNNETVKAPAREAVATGEFKIRLGADTESYYDQLYVSASEEALNEYQIGHDLAKAGVSTTVPQMYVPAYGAKLCDAEFPLVNDEATFPLTFTAPNAGTYQLYVAKAAADADLYLLRNGNIIWNLSMSAYELTLEQGTTTEYGLLLQAKAPNAATGVDSVQPSEVSIQKVIIDEHVYILRGEQMYDVTGKMVK